jgi:hypothetical protein
MVKRTISIMPAITANPMLLIDCASRTNAANKGFSLSLSEIINDHRAFMLEPNAIQVAGKNNKHPVSNFFGVNSKVIDLGHLRISVSGQHRAAYDQCCTPAFGIIQ